MNRNMPRKSLYRQYRATFCIFPAMIPLVEILPWVLGFIGALAGGVQWIQHYMNFHHRYRMAIYAVMTLSFIAAGAVYLWEKERKPDDSIGSELIVDAKKLPLLTVQRATIPPVPQQDSTTGWNLGRWPLLWSIKTDDELLGSPVISDDLMFIGTFAGTVEARSLRDGGLVWTLKKQQPVFTVAQVTGNRIYIGEGLHTADISGLTALSYPDGKPLWERQFANHIESYPAVDDAHNRLWMSAGGAGIWALEADTGKKIWWARIGHSDVAPVYTDDRLFAAAKLSEEKDGSAFFELNPDNGDVIWSGPMQGNPMGKIMDVNGHQFVASTAIGQVGLAKATNDGWVYGFDMEHSKKLRWETHLNAMMLPEGQLSADKKTAYFALENGHVVALDTNDGHILWNTPCGAEFKNDVALYEGADKALVIALTTDGVGHMLDATTGKEVQRISIGKASYPSPVYKDGVLYLAGPHVIEAFYVGNGIVK